MRNQHDMGQRKPGEKTTVCVENGGGFRTNLVTSVDGRWSWEQQEHTRHSIRTVVVAGSKWGRHLQILAFCLTGPTLAMLKQIKTWFL